MSVDAILTQAKKRFARAALMSVRPCDRREGIWSRWIAPDGRDEMSVANWSDDASITQLSRLTYRATDEDRMEIVDGEEAIMKLLGDPYWRRAHGVDLMARKTAEIAKAFERLYASRAAAREPA